MNVEKGLQKPLNRCNEEAKETSERLFLQARRFFIVIGLVMQGGNINSNVQRIYRVLIQTDSVDLCLCRSA
jgi:hypothetical protein